MRAARWRWIWCWAAAVALWFPGGGGNLPLAAELETWASGTEPIQIHSRTLEARAEENLVVFQGDVVARQGDLTLQADQVTATVDPEAQEVRVVEAGGNVRIQRQDLVATGRELKFEVASGVLTLSGDAKAWRGRNVVAGERITLHLTDNRMVVEGAKAVLVPQEHPARP